MKKTIKRTIALLLSMVMIGGAAPAMGLIGLKDWLSVTAAESGYKTGDIIEFGSYPQNEVKDQTLIDRLNEIDSEWISYEYYSGNGTYDGSMTPSDYMKYRDVTLEGTKYRAVCFTKYRPHFTRYEARIKQGGSTTPQYLNGYYTNTIYWFRYDPIKWLVLDPNTGLILSYNIIDSQAYNNTVYKYLGDYYGDVDRTYYVNDNYTKSSIRTWLNGFFCKTSFTKNQISSIQSLSTNDKVFLLNTTYVSSTKYGFNSDRLYADPLRMAKGSDYAKAQGLDVVPNGNSDWLLVDHCFSSEIMYQCNSNGTWGYHSYSYEAVANYVCMGIRPAMQIDLDAVSSQQEENEYEVAGRKFNAKIDDYTTNLNSSIYNADLANILCAFSCAVYNPQEIEKAYNSFGFVFSNLYDYDGEFNPNICGHSIGFKKSDYNGDIIFLISVRGSSTFADWVGNFALATFEDEKHIGFAYPANQIYENIQRLIFLNHFEENVKYVITGHSRGAAVANLLAVKLMESGVSASNIYDYNFACPDVACKKSFPAYNNIFNLCNREDVVSFVPGELCSEFTIGKASWGKFGKTYWFTKDEPGTINPGADHNQWLYLDFFNQKLDPEDWPDQPYLDSSGDVIKWIGRVGWLIKIYCPVNVAVVDKDGNDIASILDGEINYYGNDFGNVIIFTDGDKKIIYIDGDRNFNVTLTGTDNGTMTYSVEEYNIRTEEVMEEKTFSNVILENGKKMYSPVNDADTTNDIELFVYKNENGEKVITSIINTDGTENQYSTSKVKSVKLNGLNINYKKSGKLTTEITADPGVRYSVTYTSSNPKIVSVDNSGNVQGVKTGSATITVTVTDDQGNKVQDTCTVKVKLAFWQVLIKIFLFGWIWY